MGDIHDISYEPELSSASHAFGSCGAGRVLVSGPTDLVRLDVELRRIEHAEPTLPSGLYVFRRNGSTDAWLHLTGSRPRPASGEIRSQVAPTHWLRAAEMWFDHLWPEAVAVAPKARFSIGDHVKIKGSERVGRVEVVHELDIGHVYSVAVAGSLQTIGERGLEAHEFRANDPASWVTGPRSSARELATALTVTKLTNPLTDTVYSYLSSKTVFRPYQFRPVLRMLTTGNSRMLIADEVGLGKTIEAGLVWTELEARNPGFNRALVVCPATLVPKWRAEMKARFDRTLKVMGPSEVEELIEIVRRGEDDVPFFGVASLERMRNTNLLTRLTEHAPRFDLVIVDEAHALRNTSTLSHALGEVLSDWADSLLFLSATPVNLRSEDLRALLKLLRPDEFGDSASFDAILEPNRILNQVATGLLQKAHPRELLATLHEVEHCTLGPAIASRSAFRDLEAAFTTDAPLDAPQVASARRAVAELHTLGSVLSRTRKIDLTTHKAVREPWTVNVEWQPEERDLYQAVREWALRGHNSRSVTPIGFRMQMPLRQAASCLQAARQLLDERDPAVFDMMGRDDLDDLADPYEPDHQRVDAEHSLHRDAFVARAAARLGTIDTKFDRFAEMLDDMARRDLGPALVFSFFRRTISYLHERLEARGWKVQSMSGATPMDRRQIIMRDFRLGAYDVLLCSEVGSEGLDFEFCGLVVNYDLPWNPMKVEQRIGRIDRFNQKRDKIFVVNFHVPETIETQIFERLYERINVFRESIGDLEPILQDEMLTLQKLALDPELTAEQRAERVTQIAVAVEERRHQLEEINEARSLLAGVDQLLIDGFEDDTTSRGRFIGPDELRVLVEEFASSAGGAKLHMGRGDKVGVLLGERALADEVQRHGGADGSIYSAGELSRMLRDGEPIPVTFDNDTASREIVDLLSLRHPVVRSAASFFERRGIADHRFASVTMPVTAEALIVLYLVEATGMRASLELSPIAVRISDRQIDRQIGDQFLAALARGQLRDAGDAVPADLDELARIAAREAMRYQLETESLRRTDNDALVDLRIATTRHATSIRLAEADRLAKEHASKPIARMYVGRVANLRRQQAQEEDRLEKARDLSLSSQAIAAVHVRPGGAHR